ncbi:MAG: glutathione peroxidase [Hydrogenophilaceae bacterium]|jgi:glutathione peroxidase|nr:glutathione peroxidase [Hydrogenophilaceae bacterium]
MASAHDFHFTKLADGGDLPFSMFAGKPVLVVNVASACGLTPQYRDLEQLYESRSGRLVVLGVPCNDFGAQESGSEAEIAAFCDATYHVTFPMTGKVDILAKDKRHPFYAWIAHELGEDALPRWNFHKYLISADGALLESFGSKTAPLAPEVAAAIDRALA